MSTQQIKETELLSMYMAEVFWRVGEGERVALSLTVDEALSLVAVLQLALRSSAMDGPLGAQIRRFAESLAMRMGTTPAIAEVIRRGWLEEYDSEG